MAGSVLVEEGFPCWELVRRRPRPHPESRNEGVTGRHGASFQCCILLELPAPVCGARDPWGEAKAASLVFPEPNLRRAGR